jgi:hypothetical protein
MDFADALHLARSEGCGVLINFDRQFALLAGQLNLQPAGLHTHNSDIPWQGVPLNFLHASFSAPQPGEPV